MGIRLELVKEEHNMNPFATNCTNATNCISTLTLTYIKKKETADTREGVFRPKMGHI